MRHLGYEDYGNPWDIERAILSRITSTLLGLRGQAKNQDLPGMMTLLLDDYVPVVKGAELMMIANAHLTFARQ